MKVLVFNAGSSTLKFGFFEKTSEGINCIERGSIEHLDYSIAVENVLERLSSQYLSGSIDTIACRVVHGGEKFRKPVTINDQVVDQIQSLSKLAPLHNPIDVNIIKACKKALPDVPVVAVFDTAFHHTLPEIAATYAIPKNLSDKHTLRRYGFHGIAHKFVAKKLLEKLDNPSATSKLITCHLGNGSSVCAIKDGKSIDTSMGLTPMEGLMMGTRSGDIDPGLLLYLIETVGMTSSEVHTLLNNKSGLLGVSNKSGDVRELEKYAAKGDADVELALQIFAYRVSKYIGAYTAVLEGVDAIAFSGGIGENSSSMRTRVLKRLNYLGLLIDETCNRQNNQGVVTRISTDGSRVSCWVIQADEALQIAQEAYDHLHLEIHGK